MRNVSEQEGDVFGTKYWLNLHPSNDLMVHRICSSSLILLVSHLYVNIICSIFTFSSFEFYGISFLPFKFQFFFKRKYNKFKDGFLLYIKLLFELWNACLRNDEFYRESCILFRRFYFRPRFEQIRVCHQAFVFRFISKTLLDEFFRPGSGTSNNFNIRALLFSTRENKPRLT